MPGAGCGPGNTEGLVRLSEQVGPGGGGGRAGAWRSSPPAARSSPHSWHQEAPALPGPVLGRYQPDLTALLQLHPPRAPCDAGGRRRGEVSSQPLPPTHRLQGPGPCLALETPTASSRAHRQAGPWEPARPGAPEPPGQPRPCPWELGTWAPTRQESWAGTPDATATPLPKAGWLAGWAGLLLRPTEVGRNPHSVPVGTVWAEIVLSLRPRPAAPLRGAGGTQAPARPSPTWASACPPASRHRRPGSQASAQPRSRPSWLSALLSCRSHGVEGTWVLTPGPAAWL